MALEDKPLIQATLGDLRELLEDMFSSSLKSDVESELEIKKHLVYGLTGLANLLGVCKATASNIKRSGILDPAISQRGKVIVVDADLALELMKAKDNAARRRLVC